MPVDVFIDTNILIYAYDLDAGEKRTVALGLVERGWAEAGSAAISVQVLQELYVNLVRKGRAHEEAVTILNDLSTWPVVENSLALLHAALDLKSRWQVSFWDALILAAARQSGAATLLSKDLNNGQDYGGVRVRNPFVSAVS
jgi:predicted nucleic acid-binding protein